MSKCCSAIAICEDLFSPEFMIHRKLGNLYRDHPLSSRLVAVPLAVLTGALKVAAFPFIAIIGAIACPIIALVQLYRGDKESSCNWLKVGGFCILGVAGSLTFLALFSFHLPILWSGILGASAITVSIVIHVYKAAKEPILPLSDS